MSIDSGYLSALAAVEEHDVLVVPQGHTAHAPGM